MIVSKAGMHCEQHCLLEQSVGHQRLTLASNLLIWTYSPTQPVSIFVKHLFDNFIPSLHREEFCNRCISFCLFSVDIVSLHFQNISHMVCLDS